MLGIQNRIEYISCFQNLAVFYVKHCSNTVKTAKDHERWIYNVWKLENKGNFIKKKFKSYPLRPEQNGCGCTGLEEGFHSKGK